MGTDFGPIGRLQLIPTRVLAGAYLDLGHDIRDTTLVVSTGRSGSTWVAEIINHRNEYRLVFEPFRSERVRTARPFRLGQYIDPADQKHPLAGRIDALLAGRVRSWWTDGQNRRRIASRRIVKEIRITNLVPWIRARHPELPIVYVVRDPVAVARSWLELGWGDRLADFLGQGELLGQFAGIEREVEELARSGDQFERHVLRWCLENAILLRGHAALDVHRVDFGRLATQPELELDPLFAYLARDASGALAAVGKPSATAAFPRVARVTITDAQKARAKEILALFGLTGLAPDSPVGH